MVAWSPNATGKSMRPKHAAVHRMLLAACFFWAPNLIDLSIHEISSIHRSMKSRRSIDPRNLIEPWNLIDPSIHEISSIRETFIDPPEP